MSSNPLGPEWNLSPNGINLVTDNGAIKDPKVILKRALDSDLKAVGKPALSSELSKSQLDKVVLQIQKIRNISAPKAKEDSQAAPRMLKLTLTDGDSYIQAIEVTTINSIGRERTAPGTKALINGAKVVSGYLLIGPENFSILGGQVEHLYEKWILAKSVQKNHQYVSSSGAPSWVAFGCKILSGNQQDQTFKSLEKNKEDCMESEFDQQRKEAIAEASSGAIKKTFAGRVRQTVQPTQNNQQHQRGKPNDRESRRNKLAPKDDEVLEKLQKPSEKVSLFSFLEDKLPITEPKKGSAPSTNYNQKEPRFQQKNEPRQNSKPQYDKNSTSNQFNSYNNSAFKSTKNYPAPRDRAINNENFRSSAGENRTSSHRNSEKSNANNLSQHGYTKGQATSDSKNNQHQYQGVSNQNRYPQLSNSNSTGAYPRDNFGYQQNQFRSNEDRFSHPQNPIKDNSNYQQHPQMGPHFTRQHYSNANNYPQQNNQYQQRPQQNPPAQPASLENSEIVHLANNLSKMSVNNEFASRSLRQHLNLGPQKKQDTREKGSGFLNVGDQCLAKYWEDGKFYPAVISAITEKTYAVQFQGYGNIEEVLKSDCFSTSNSHNQQNKNTNYNVQQNNFSGNSMEFRSRRGPPRN